MFYFLTISFVKPEEWNNGTMSIKQRCERHLKTLIYMLVMEEREDEKKILK